jgi:hypothetical protein
MAFLWVSAILMVWYYYTVHSVYTYSVCNLRMTGTTRTKKKPLGFAWPESCWRAIVESEQVILFVTSVILEDLGGRMYCIVESVECSIFRFLPSSCRLFLLLFHPSLQESNRNTHPCPLCFVSLSARLRIYRATSRSFGNWVFLISY